MFKSLILLGITTYSTLYGYSLKESVLDTLRNNPIIQERLKNFRATQQDKNIAQSEYFPSLDIRATGAYTQAGAVKKDGNDDFDHTVNSSEYLSYESSLVYTHNLFNGFSTTSKVNFEENRILAAAYKYLEKVNDLAFQMTNAYLEVLKSDALVKTSMQNVQINEDIYNKVKDLFEAGLTTDSEVKKIQATLSLARSNLTVQKNNARDTMYKYRRVLGRLPDVSVMQKPDLDVKMPESIERAALYAIENNPSLLVSKHNIMGAQYLWKQKQSGYYPSLDLEVSQNFNDHDQLANGFDQADDRFRARLTLSYNLFRGGADDAETQKYISNLNQEVEIQRDLKRQVIEGLDLSWTAYEMIGKQLVDLKEYSQYSEKTLELYKEEYDLGRRSLLDLLSAQNDVINSRSQIIQAEYDQLFAKYRILDAMGLLVLAINGTTDEFTTKVNLYTDDAKEILDTKKISLDVDNDKIADNIDLCDNSDEGNNIMPYGCKKVSLEYKLEPKKIEDEIKDSKKVESPVQKTSENELVDDTQKFSHLLNETKTLYFGRNNVDIDEVFNQSMQESLQFLEKDKDVKVVITGHTSKEKTSQHEYNMKLSKQRAQSVKEQFVKYGIDPSRIITVGQGFNEPLADNGTVEGRLQNRRAEITLFKMNNINGPLL